MGDERCELADGEKRVEFERTIKKNELQLYRNQMQQNCPALFEANRLRERKRQECAFLTNLKKVAWNLPFIRDFKIKEDSNAKLRIDIKESEEELAKFLREQDDLRENIYRKRLQLRNSEPELRKLADQIRNRISGHILATQIENRRRQRLKDLEEEFSLEREMVEADRLAEQRDIQKRSLFLEQMRDDMIRAMAEQRTGDTPRHRAELAEKEESRRLIEDIVAEENERIKAEQEAKRHKREKLNKEYLEFIASHQDKRDGKAEAEGALLKELEKQRKILDNRRDEEIRRRVALVNKRIEAQEAVGAYTSAIREAKEHQLTDYLDANETIAMATDTLYEYNKTENHFGNKVESAKEKREELDRLAEYRRRVKEEELEEERELERRNAEAWKKEKDRIAAEQLEKKRRVREGIMEHMEKRRQILAEEARKQREEDEQIKRYQKQRDARVETERKAMLTEYADFLDFFVKCEPKSEVGNDQKQ
ncbi:hypothetical protein T265_11278 [Opisthorchis viverrini]|uniref:Trichohyalin-plectin-homology domain-containing protein n=1 Tax=Opisthorchis viverrini TaxID=6198 RepID=A0A074ZY36_OPIVI|nr:hypothetical protein T265_11278 [Opisthorchis viverrini]KER20094.1 hypothetical protein T265_11278 [Opisthorchis viverrini]